MTMKLKSIALAACIAGSLTATAAPASASEVDPVCVRQGFGPANEVCVWYQENGFVVGVGVYPVGGGPYRDYTAEAGVCYGTTLPVCTRIPR
ncbi:MAG TPA: hypothetical protein VHJ76_04890 [Actinomycetota bacterium]|nr:hypothetical protein [Actinomycetota bacterium]